MATNLVLQDSDDQQNEDSNAKKLEIAKGYFSELQSLIDEWRNVGYGEQNKLSKLALKVRGLLVKVHPDRNPNNEYLLEIAKLTSVLFDSCKNPGNFSFRHKDDFLDDVAQLKRSLSAVSQPAAYEYEEEAPRQETRSRVNDVWEDKFDDDEEDETDEKLPYETEDFEINQSIKGKRILWAEADLPHTLHEICKYHITQRDGYAPYGETYGSTMLKIEGIPGVIIAHIHGPDDYRDSFYGWVHIKNVEPTSTKDLGTVRRVTRGESDNTGSVFQRIITDSHTIEFGTNDSVDYYPHGYATVYRNK